MTEDEALFEAQPVRRLRAGDWVKITTMWGEETCLVTRVHTEDDFPMVELRTPSGDVVSVSVGRVKRTDE
jgi:hypothetical protein